MTYYLLLHFIISGILVGIVYGLIGIGFSLVHGASRVINFSHGEFVVYGGLIGSTLSSLDVSIGLIFIAAIILCSLMGFMLAAVIDRVKGPHNELNMVMVTVGFALAISGIARNIWGTTFHSFDLYPDGGIDIGSLSISYSLLIIVFLSVVIAGIIWVMLFKTMIGLSLRACSDSTLIARSIGINARRITIYSYVISCALGGVAGVLLTPIMTMSYSDGVALTIKGLAAAIVGGLSNPLGAVAGGVILGICESLGVGVLSSDFQDSYALIVLLIILSLKPSGIFGVKELEAR